MTQQLLALLAHGFDAHQQGNLAEAEHCYQQILSVQTEQVDALYLLGVLKMQYGDLQNAALLLGRVVKLVPNHVDAHLHLGAAQAQQGQIEPAMTYFAKAKTLAPENPTSFFNMGLAYAGLEQYENAIVEFQTALKLNPTYVEAINNLGNVYHKLGRYQEAVECFRKSLDLVSDYPNALLGLGAALCKCEAYEAALDPIDRLLQIVPNASEAHENKGVVLAGLHDYSGAINEYKKALALNPNVSWETYLKLGMAYAKQSSYVDAFAAFQRSLELNPSSSDTYLALGITHEMLKQYTEGFASYRKAIELNPDNLEAVIALGNLLLSTGKPAEAVGYLKAAYEVDPAHEYVTGALLHGKMKVCDWQGFEALLRVALEGASSNKTYAQVFTILPTPSSPEQQKQYAEHYVERQFGQIKPLPPSIPKQEQEKIRIAYLSADFFNHATAFLMAELFELHDRERFDIIGICYGRSPDDEMRRRVSQSFDQFLEVADKSDQEIADLIHGLGIDIAVDLKGHTTDARLGILAYRPAPVQVHYLGYPGTTGAAFMDYLIADPLLIPPDHQPYYTEKIAYLPDCYQVNDSQRRISDRTFTRTELGLPETGFVFCSFNNNFKITPDLFDTWMNLLKRVEGSVLWLLQDNETAAENLRKEAVARGIEANRLVFAKRMPLADHLARHRCADLFLDTWYYNAHTTTSDALWAGLPLVTKIGDTFAGRVAASLLTAMALPDLITDTPQAYESLAYELATAPAKLQSFRARLAKSKQTAPLFDTLHFTRHLEDAYEQILSRSRQGLEPDHIFVPALTA